MDDLLMIIVNLEEEVMRLKLQLEERPIARVKETGSKGSLEDVGSKGSLEEIDLMAEIESESKQ